MTKENTMIRVALIGAGNCARALVDGVEFYRKFGTDAPGLLFPTIAGYTVSNIRFCLAFDVSLHKVGQTLDIAIQAPPNNAPAIPNLVVKNKAPVLRGPTLDGNPHHLATLVPEHPSEPVDVASALRDHRIDIVVNFLPTGSVEATRYYAMEAAKAGCGFINCIPTPLAQLEEYREMFQDRQVPLLGDDIKSQVGTTILHRALLKMLVTRGASLSSSSQINIGGNTDFRNFTERAETKLVSKRYSLQQYTADCPSHVGHHFDVTRGAYKTAVIDVNAKVFGGSDVVLSIRLQSDDKPNVQ